MTDPRNFDVWMSWLKDFGGKFVPVVNNDDPSPRTGRRDPDRKPRQYELGDKYGINSNGSVIRLEIKP